MQQRKGQSQPIPAQQPPSDLQLLRISEVALLLGTKRTSVYRLIHQEGLPAITLGRNGELRIARTALQQWVANQETVRGE